MPLAAAVPPAAAPPTAAERLQLKRASGHTQNDVVAEARAARVQRAVDPKTQGAAPAKLPSRLVAALAAQAALDGPGGPTAAEAADLAARAHDAQPKAIAEQKLTLGPR